jgi:hypothetical protein
MRQIKEALSWTSRRHPFFGFGLALGTEFMPQKGLVGGNTNALKLYKSLRDPHSAFDSSPRQYAFMTIGPVSPLSFADTSLFLILLLLVIHQRNFK